MKIKDLIAKMTPAEKIGQINQLGASIYGRVNEEGFEEMVRRGQVGSFLSAVGCEKVNRYQRIAVTESRLKIPVLFAADVVHGIKTIFPTPLAESCSWNPDIARQTAESAAFEATALGLKWTYAPMVDIARDCRWGRVMEGAGEDTYLACLFAKARVEGFQGESAAKGGQADPFHMAACAKHFACYGAAEGGRDYNSVQVSPYIMNNVYLPPFKVCAESGVMSFMTAFNEINGTPCTVSHELNQKILREMWGFDGMLVTDWQSLKEVISHGYCADGEECAYLAAYCGVSADMAGEIYFQHIEKLLKDGRIKEEVIDGLVEHVLSVKERLGLFDNPYADEKREKTDLMAPPALQTALMSAENSIVLLKNDNILPLKDKTRILLVGSLADNKEEMLGNWAPRDTANKVVSILEGLKEYFDVTYLKGYELDSFTEGFQKKAKELSEKCDVIVAVAGESLYDSGEARCKADIALRSCHREAVDLLSRLNKPLITLLVNGRPLAIEDEAQKCAAFVECWQLGTMAGKAIANVLSGRFNPQGRLTMSFPRKTGQCPLYYNGFSTGRPYDPENFYTSKYLDCKHGPAFEFGYGLSYSDFHYGKAALSRAFAKKGETVTLTVDVANKSAVEGTETVQLYFRDIVSKPVRPVKELLRFSKLRLAPGETKTAVFSFSASDLGMYYDASLEKKVFEGKFELYIGKSSRDTQVMDFEVLPD